MLTLSRGERLGPYEIRAVLGNGSMGEIYRARDTRMGRNVALKVLNAATLARGPVLLQRFELEARAAGSLNHPNLVTVHDFGEHQGTPFFVTEYLEGETLSERLGKGPIRARKAIDYAIQIARGLSAVHEHGILHRDLKPDNIFITRDERIKILDFGVAKLIDKEARAQLLGSKGSLTAPGVVLGTARFVSPEQARDLPLDHRSDLFSLGLLLYEMLAGKPAFRGPTVEVMTAIVKQDPPELVYPGEQIPGLELVVRHCLEKSPERRVQSARDLIFQLETVSGTGEAREAPPPPKRSPWLRAALALACLALPVAAFLAGRRASATVPPAFHKLTFRRGLIGAARFAPDGETVVYSANWDASGKLQLFTTRPESPESRSLGIADAKILSVSRSGELAIQLGQPVGTLARVPIGGGAPREWIEGVYEADWSPDGASIAVVRVEKGRFRLEYPPGKVLYESKGWLSGARVSASGEQVAFIEHPLPGYTRGTVTVVDRAGAPRALGRAWPNAMGLAWAPGDEIWFTAGEVAGETAVHAVNLRGDERLVMPSTGNLALQDVAPGGRMLLSQTSLRWALMAARDGATPRDLSWMDGSLLADLSDDGKALLSLEVGVAQRAGSAIYLRKTDGSPAVKLGQGSVSRLSPDGRWVLAAPGAEFSRELLMLPTGTGEAVKVPLGAVTLSGDPIWFPDGKRLLLRGREGAGKDRLFALDLPAGTPRPVTGEGLADNGALSPDGGRLVASDAQGQLWIQPSAGGEARRVEGADPGESIAGWSADGSALFVLQQKPPSIARLVLATGKKEPLRTLLLPDPAGAGRILWARMTPDGRSYAYNYDISLNDLYLVEGVR